MNGFLPSALIYLGAAVVCVPIAKKLGLGSVLGYLLAGMAIGPYALGFVGNEGEDIMHFAEFGVVMMLFLVGLELEPAKFWRMRKKVLGIGTAQFLFTLFPIFILAKVWGLQWNQSLALGMAIAMSSTAIVLQTLKERNALAHTVGQNSFAVLLFQDIAVIPILALLPLLAMDTSEIHTGSTHNLLDGQPGWVTTLAVLGSMAGVVVAGRFLVVPMMRLVAQTKLRELFSASSLLIVVAIALLMELVGLSPALGTFLAGVVLANSEFKHELESDLEPFKGLLLGLFFIGVGASVNFELIFKHPGLLLALVSSILVVKAIVLFGIGKFSKLHVHENTLFALIMCQVGEFAFVLFSFIGQLKILDKPQVDLMMAVVTLSMVATPILLLVNDKLLQPRLKPRKSPFREPDTIEGTKKVIIVGFSHFGSTMGRFLRANGVDATILDNDPDTVDLLRKMGFKVYYGDATRLDLLESAGIKSADLLISTIGSPDVNYELAVLLKKHYPHVDFMVRTRNRWTAYELMAVDVRNIYRETLDTSIRMGVEALTKLGFRHYAAYRAGQNFLRYDQESMEKLAQNRHDRNQYIQGVRDQIAMQEELLRNDAKAKMNLDDHAWDSAFMRDQLNPSKN